MELSRLRAHFAGAVALSLLAAHAVSGQELIAVTPKILKQHRDEYMQAMEEWQNGDKSLEKDLHSGDRQSLIQRIDKEAARTAKFLESKRTYFSSLRSYYQDQYIKVEGAAGSGAKPPQSKEELQEHIDSVGRERADLDDRIRGTKEVDVQQKLIMQRSALKVIQDNLLEQKALVDRWDRADTGIAASKKAMLASLRRITEVLSVQEKGVAEIKDQLDRVYDSMRATAGPVTAPPAPPVREAQPQPQPPATQPPPKPPVTSPPPEPAAAPPAPAASIAGTWLFAGAGDPAVPQSVRLEIAMNDSSIMGSFTATQVPRTFRLPANTALTFSGPRTEQKFRWTLNGLSGSIELIPAGASLEVVWKLDNVKDPLLDKEFGRVSK